MRAIVHDSDPGLVEGIKWNAPSWSHDGADRITVNTMNKARQVMLVLHMGAGRPEDRSAPPVLEDTDGLVAWSSDIRGVVAFTDLADVEAKAPALRAVLQRWLAIPV